MANPQKEKGHTPIANEILDEVLKRKFTKRQDRILNIVWRFSYGFNKKDAYFPEMKTFAMYGIAPQVIGSELKQLETLRVIDVDWDNGVIRFNKDYEMWEVPYHETFVDGIHKYVMRLNLRPSERKTGGWNSSRRGGGRPAVGSQNINQDRLMKHKPVGYENNNLQVNEIITQPEHGVNDTAALQAQKASRKQVGLKTSKAKPDQSPDPNQEIDQQSTIDDSYGIITEHTADDWIEYLIHIMKKPEQKYAPIAVQELAQWLVSNNDLELIEQCYDEFCQVPLKKVFNRTGFFLKIISDVGGNTDFRQ